MGNSPVRFRAAPPSNNQHRIQQFSNTRRDDMRRRATLLNYAVNGWVIGWGLDIDMTDDGAASVTVAIFEHEDGTTDFRRMGTFRFIDTDDIKVPPKTIGN